jgi:hypothetical protein
MPEAQFPRISSCGNSSFLLEASEEACFMHFPSSYLSEIESFAEVFFINLSELA